MSGYAWSDTAGWINFSPANGGVNIDSGGIFSGHAWGENIGWVVFNCQDLDVCDISDFKVKTSWRPLSVRNSGETEDLEISDVHYSSTDTIIVINWDTNHDSNSHIRWGTDKNLEKEKNQNKKEKKHRSVLRDLTPDTRYYFRLKSTDENDKSDTSKIYSISTKSSSAIFAKREWQKPENLEENQKTYEKVNVEVSDKKETEIKKDEKSIISGVFGAIKDGISNFFLGAYDLALSGQRKIAQFFKNSSDQIASVYNSVISKFSASKSIEIAKEKQNRFFTTLVFSRDEKKMLAEVRFQILDKKDNPIPDLETKLFSDPQSAKTDGNGIASFKDVPIGSHTLAFDYQGEEFKKKVAISDTLTEEGKVSAEVVKVKAEKEKLALWMWAVIILLILAVAGTVYFARKYYRLKNKNLS